MSTLVKRIIVSNFYTWSLFLATYKAAGTFRSFYYGLQRNKSEANIYNLRRNIHRLEKGLSYQKPKPVFAEDYINSTVSQLSILFNNNSLDDQTVKWAAAVLENYFKRVTKTEKIAQANKSFLSLGIQNINPEYIPYSSGTRPDLEVSYNNLFNLAKRRRSTRFYLDKAVGSELIEQALQIAAQSPSACNRQSYRFFFYNEKERVEAISKIPGGVSGYTVPSIVVVVGRYRGYFDERDLFVPFIDASLATMSFLFALETLDLASVAINWPQSKTSDRKIRRIVPMQDDECVVMLVGVGYPDPEGKIPYSAKVPVHSGLLSVNEFADKNEYQ